MWGQARSWTRGQASLDYVVGQLSRWHCAKPEAGPQELDGNADVILTRNRVVTGPTEKGMGEEWYGCSLREFHRPRRAAQVPLSSWEGTGFDALRGSRRV